MRGTDAGTGSLGDHRGPNVGEDPSLPALQAWSTQHHRANAGQDPVNQADSRERRGGCEAWASCGVSNSFPVTRAGASRARQPCSEGHGPPARPQCLTPSSGTGAKPTRGKTQAKVPTIEVRPSVASRTAGTGLTPKPLPTTSRSFCPRRLHLALPAGNRAERLHTGG